jgi:hypothetical protein
MPQHLYSVYPGIRKKIKALTMTYRNPHDPPKSVEGTILVTYNPVAKINKYMENTIIYLAIFFMIGDTPSIKSGWYPTIHETVDICNARLEFMETYLNTISPEHPVAEILCGTEEEIQLYIDNN